MFQNRDHCRRGIPRLMWNADLETAADRYVKTCAKRRAAAAQIFASGIFFEGEPAGIAPRTRRGRRTEILRSDLCLGTVSLVWTHGLGPPFNGHLACEETFYILDHFRRRARRMHDPA